MNLIGRINSYFGDDRLAVIAIGLAVIVMFILVFKLISDDRRP